MDMCYVKALCLRGQKMSPDAYDLCRMCKWAASGCVRISGLCTCHTVNCKAWFGVYKPLFCPHARASLRLSMHIQTCPHFPQKTLSLPGGSHLALQLTPVLLTSSWISNQSHPCSQREWAVMEAVWPLPAYCHSWGWPCPQRPSCVTLPSRSRV